MSSRTKQLVIAALTTAMLAVGALSALGVEDITTGPPTDAPTDSTVVPAVPGRPAAPVIGEIKVSSISFERRVAHQTITYFFVYTGPGSIDFEYDDPDGCLVALRGVAHTAISYCAR